MHNAAIKFGVRCIHELERPALGEKRRRSGAAKQDGLPG
jgi:hypothetical protein